MSKAVKRQRKKDQRRQRIEEEVKQARAKRRRRLTINLAIVGIVVAGISFLVSAQRQTETSKDDEEVKCQVNEEPTDNSAKKIAPPELTVDKSKAYTATIETSEGIIVVDLDVDNAPCTAESFVYLAQQGFFDGLTFHRIVPGFAIQGGDPNGDGGGGPGYRVVEAPPAETKYEKGIVAMAKTGADPAGASGSQFFIVPGEGAASLNGAPGSPAQYALLGRVKEGLDVLAKIEARPRDGERPVEPIKIVKITILESSKTP